MDQRESITGWLIGWVCFVGFVTWLDYLTVMTLTSTSLSLAARVTSYLIVAFFTAVAVRRALCYPSAQHALLTLSLIWLLVLPFVPWNETKVMVTLSGFLVPGMTKTQVQSIMSAYPGAHDVYNNGAIFCTEENWTYSKCEEIVTVVLVRMKDDKLQSVEIDWD